jgi:hypothetical protein
MITHTHTHTHTKNYQTIYSRREMQPAALVKPDHQIHSYALISPPRLMPPWPNPPFGQWRMDKIRRNRNFVSVIASAVKCWVVQAQIPRIPGNLTQVASHLTATDTCLSTFPLNTYVVAIRTQPLEDRQIPGTRETTIRCVNIGKPK